MKSLKIVLAINGLVFFVRAVTNIFKPTSWYIDSDAPKSAVDTVHVLGITYAALGVTQMGMWPVADLRAVRAVSGASALFAAGIAIKALTQGSGSATAQQRMRYASAAENVAVAALYAVLLYRERPPGNGREGRVPSPQ